MILNLIFFTSFLFRFIDSMLMDDQTQEIIAARCYSKCLLIFIRFKSKEGMSKSGPENFTTTPIGDRDSQQLSFVDEIAQHLQINKPAMVTCLNDVENSCSKQCIQSCSMIGECICQQNDIGCFLACYYRKEMAKESSLEECPLISSVEESSLKIPISQCPKTCKSKDECNSNQLCCTTETCGMICLQIEKRKPNFPKYKPENTQPNNSISIEFDWSNNFKPFLNKESPLVFILQIRSCLCQTFIEKYSTPWQTLIRTHRLGVKLNTFDNGTIYQFRLAAVTYYGTNGFGPLSDNLPSVISKPPPPLPPENLIDYKWQITDENRFRVQIKWNKSVDPFWRSFEFLIIWMVDHGVAQPDGEPLSSLTQYSKTLLGTEESCTIDGLRPATTYKIQIVVKAYWPGQGSIVSSPSLIYITTPATSETTGINTETMSSNVRSKECSCPDRYVNAKDPKIGTPTLSNRNLQVTLDMQTHSDYLVEGYPEVCISLGNENLSKSIQGFQKLHKNTAQITLTNLRFNCRYSVDVTSMSKPLTNVTYHLCFCTPPCSNPYQSKYCHREDISLPSPKEAQSSLLDIDTMTYKISWKPSYRAIPRNRIFDVTKYRISWAPRKFEPVRIEHYLESTGFDPILDFDQSDVKIVHSNVTLFLLRNLTREKLYVVRIQSLGLTPSGEVIESFPATILLPTFGYSDDFYTNTSQRLYCINFLIFLITFFKASHSCLAA